MQSLDAHDFKQLALELDRTGQGEKAAFAYRQALVYAPTDEEALLNLASVLMKQKAWAEAQIPLRTAELVAPLNAMTWNNLGLLTMYHHEELETALQHFQRAAELGPELPHAFANLAYCAQLLALWDTAEAAYEAVLRLNPMQWDVRLFYAILRMLRGDFATGLPEYETRLMNYNPLPVNGKTIWTGELLEGKRVVIFCEQGAGDTIQTIRYAAYMRTHLGAAHISVVAKQDLKRLLMTVFGVDAVFAPDEDYGLDYDYHVASMSLIGIMHKLQTSFFYGKPAYILLGKPWTPEPASSLRVGLCWKGNQAHGNDRWRSVDLRTLRPILDMAGEDVKFGSLQYKESVYGDLFEFTGENEGDFLDLANKIATLDLVITVDTAVAHLAATRGVPTWVLLPYNPDWRWGTEGATTPWYPAMVLYRQTEQGQWGPVVERILLDLREMVRLRKETP